MTSRRTVRQELAALEQAYDGAIEKARAGDRQNADLLLGTLLRFQRAPMHLKPLADHQ